jgi:hypothetical protein
VIFRVYNGWTGNGAVHRVVVADNAEQAVALAAAAWAERDPKWAQARLEAEAVDLDERGVEIPEYDD